MHIEWSIVTPIIAMIGFLGGLVGLYYAVKQTLAVFVVKLEDALLNLVSWTVPARVHTLGTQGVWINLRCTVRNTI